MNDEAVEQARRERLIRDAFRLEWLTIVWMTIEAAVAIGQDEHPRLDTQAALAQIDAPIGCVPPGLCRRIHILGWSGSVPGNDEAAFP